MESTSRARAETRPRLVLLCGLPGSGKSTQARQRAEALRAIRLSEDDWMAGLAVDLWDEGTRSRLEMLFWRLAQELLRHGQSVVLESGFWTRAERDEKRVGARQIGAAVELRYLNVPIDELVRRLQGRARPDGPCARRIRRGDLESWQRAFEPPSEEELALFDPPEPPD